MRRKGLSLAVLAALIAASPAHAQGPTRQEYIETTGRPKPVPEVPGALRSIVVEATPERLAMRAYYDRPGRTREEEAGGG